MIVGAPAPHEATASHGGGGVEATGPPTWTPGPPYMQLFDPRIHLILSQVVPFHGLLGSDCDHLAMPVAGSSGCVSAPRPVARCRGRGLIWEPLFMGQMVLWCGLLQNPGGPSMTPSDRGLVETYHRPL